MNLYDVLSLDLLPTSVLRFGVKNAVAQKHRIESSGSNSMRREKLMRFVEELKSGPIAIEEERANEQHYELPAEFFKLVLGPQKKYSCGLWLSNGETLESAELNMLELYCERADLRDGQSIMELGCGWGSLCLHLAKKFSNSKITALSNSATQRQFIEEEAQRLGLNNLRVITANVAQFETDEKFDRIVSIEMFEHMKNYEKLLHKVSNWLTLDGLLFIHIFTHREFAYHFEAQDESDWLAKHFFAGGTMPSDSLLLYFQDDLKLVKHWVVNGTHYEKTANAWLSNLTHNKAQVLQTFSAVYGRQNAVKWFVYWKLFFLACAELWGFREGNEWFVSHYLFQLPQAVARATDRAPAASFSQQA